MSLRMVPQRVCDGCGTAIDIDFYITLTPHNQQVIQQDRQRDPARHFCGSACEAWWHAQFPAAGPWGPAWDERDWWCKRVGPCAERSRVRTVHTDAPLMDMEFHDADPEKLG